MIYVRVRILDGPALPLPVVCDFLSNQHPRMPTIQLSISLSASVSFVHPASMMPLTSNQFVLFVRQWVMYPSSSTIHSWFPESINFIHRQNFWSIITGVYYLLIFMRVYGSLVDLLRLTSQVYVSILLTSNHGCPPSPVLSAGGSSYPHSGLSVCICVVSHTPCIHLLHGCPLIEPVVLSVRQGVTYPFQLISWFPIPLFTFKLGKQEISGVWNYSIRFTYLSYINKTCLLNWCCHQDTCIDTYIMILLLLLFCTLP